MFDYKMYDNNGYIVRHEPVTDYRKVLSTHTSWNSPEADKERTIFGAQEKSLHYVYSDRLQQWDYYKDQNAREIARSLCEKNTAEFFAIMLSFYHNCQYVALQHIIAGCNRSNGFPYLIFGFNCSKDRAELSGTVYKLCYIERFTKWCNEEYIDA